MASLRSAPTGSATTLPGWVWAPGHYEWRGGEYAWMEGHWMRERVGYEYREPRWVQRGNGQWALVGGNWEHRMDRERHAREPAAAWVHDRLPTAVDYSSTSK